MSAIWESANWTRQFGIRQTGMLPYKQMKSSQNIQRLGHTKFTSCSSDVVLKTLERASDLKMLISFPFYFASFLMSET